MTIHPLTGQGIDTFAQPHLVGSLIIHDGSAARFISLSSDFVPAALNEELSFTFELTPAQFTLSTKTRFD